MEERVTSIETTTGIIQPQRGGDFLPEDIYPALDITQVEDSLRSWFDSDLRRCAEYVNSHVADWDKARRIYMMLEVEQMYSEISRANFPSGLLCEKVIEMMDRLKRAIYVVAPLFAVDMDSSRIEDIELVHRLEKFMDDIFQNVLKVRKTLGNEALFDFIMDGSLIVEPDMLFQVIPRRTVKTYTDADSLRVDEALIMDISQLEDAYAKLGRGEPVRLVVETDYEERQGLQLFVVNKVDHLIPPGVYKDEHIRFRARRLYFTKTDLQVMASPSVNWYKQDDVDKVIGYRETIINQLRDKETPDKFDEMRKDGQLGLGFDWDRLYSDVLQDKGEFPYKDIYPIYRILAKYAYPTKKDSKGLIPKWCIFDYEYSSRTILRARIYPHVHDLLPWIHFKAGFKPKSYYGMGFGDLLVQEDSRQTNILNLFMDAAAMASFPPFVTIHPDYGGVTPFRGGMGPGQMGWVRSIGDFQALQIPHPAEALVSRLYPISVRHAENRSGITGYAMGQEASYDPRSPARKAELLLGQAQISVESIVYDWNSAWETLAEIVWLSLGEIVLIRGPEALPNVLPTISAEAEPVGAQISTDELNMKIVWKAQATSMMINPEYRKTQFIRQFSFFAPLLQALAQINPQLYLKYFLRWMERAAQELELRGIRWLIPSMEEFTPEAAPEMTKALTTMQEMMKTGAAEPLPPQPERPPTEETEE